VGLGHVEVIDGIAPHIGIAEVVGGRVEGQVKADQPLAAGLLGLHPDFHDAFADRAVVLVLGEMADFEKHYAGSLCSMG